MKKILVLFLVFILLISTAAITLAKPEVEAPSKVKVIAQNTAFSALCLTVIDLSNNEVVILEYDASRNMKLCVVTRTGMFVNPNEQGSLISTDQPQTPNNNIKK